MATGRLVPRRGRRRPEAELGSPEHTHLWALRFSVSFADGTSAGPARARGRLGRDGGRGAQARSAGSLAPQSAAEGILDRDRQRGACPPGPRGRMQAPGFLLAGMSAPQRKQLENTTWKAKRAAVLAARPGHRGASRSWLPAGGGGAGPARVWEEGGSPRAPREGPLRSAGRERGPPSPRPRERPGGVPAERERGLPARAVVSAPAAEQPRRVSLGAGLAGRARRERPVCPGVGGTGLCSSGLTRPFPSCLSRRGSSTPPRTPPASPLRRVEPGRPSGSLEGQSPGAGVGGVPRQVPPSPLRV